MARKKLDFGAEQDMTPMIDIVFLLIIFFMVVTELTLDQAELILPVATEAKVVEPQPGDRVITINVSLDREADDPLAADPVIQIRNGPRLDQEQLIKELKAEAAAFDKWIPKPNAPGERDSAIQVVIRCDQYAKAKNFHEIFEAAQKAKIFKVSLAAQNERLGDAYNPD